MSLSFGIESKSEIESVIGSSDLIPENELHVQRETTYAKRLNGVDSEVSVALVAKTDKKSGGLDYIIGYLENAAVVFNDIQARPIMVNHGMVQRAVDEFADNDVYPKYGIEIVSPPMDLFEFFRSRGALSPRATPDRSYRR